MRFLKYLLSKYYHAEMYYLIPNIYIVALSPQSHMNQVLLYRRSWCVITGCALYWFGVLMVMGGTTYRLSNPTDKCPDGETTH